MIAIESIKKFRRFDFATIIFLALIWSILNYVFSSFKDILSAYILSLFLLIFIGTFLVLLVKKAGTITLYYLVCAVFTANIGILGPTGINKLIVFVLAGVVFELFYLFLKLEIHLLPIDIIGSASLSAASIPLMTSFILSFGVTVSMVTSVVNMVLLSFFLGLAGSMLLFIIWQKIKSSKLIIKLENNFY